MANSGGKITKRSDSGISILADIRYVLGETSRDIGTLCTSPKINKWAKYKPIHYNKWSMNDSQRDAVDDSVPGRTLSNGLLVPVYRDIQSFKNAVDTGDGEHYYTYIRPTGGSASPFRVYDFICQTSTTKGYDHNAKGPIAGIRSNVGQEYYEIIFDTNVQTDDQVKLVDLVPNGDYAHLDSYYLGALVYEKTTGLLALAHINKSSYGDMSSIKIERAQLTDNKDYVAYPFFSKYSDITMDKYLCPIEGIGKYEFKIGANFTIAAKAYWLDATTRNAAYLQWSITSHVSNFSNRMMLQVVDSNGNQVGRMEEVNVSLDAGQSMPASGYSIWNVSNLQGTSQNYRFKITVDYYEQYINILTHLDV